MKRLRIFENVKINPQGTVERKIVGIQPLDDSPGTFILRDKNAIVKAYVKFEQVLTFAPRLYNDIVNFLCLQADGDQYMDIDAADLMVSIRIFADPAPKPPQMPPKGNLVVPGEWNKRN